jgi:hypothetical protein
VGKAYCPQCGWNREAAEKQALLFQRFLPVLVILCDAPLIVWIIKGGSGVAILVALIALAILPAILVVLAVRWRVRLAVSKSRAAQPAATVTSQAGTPSISAPSEKVAREYALLAELPRPRPVHMSRQGKINVAIISIALLAFAIALFAMAVMQPAVAGRNPTPPRPLAYVVALGVVALIVFVMLRSLDRQRGLLAEGELAMARVTKQWIARNGTGIQYEFTTRAGEIFSHMTTDNSRQLLVGMTAPVFYDPQQPKRQVALCASFYEIKLSRNE